jgi:hypothetical protein
MQFTPDSIALIQSGIKTVTRRPCKECDEILDVRIPNGSGYDIFEAVFRNGRRMWMVGNDYAICPGRGKKAVGRLRITSLRLQTLGEITDEDALLEGMIHSQYFPSEWAYGCTNFKTPTRREAYLALWASMYGHADPSEKVWAIGFEIVKEKP